MLTQTECHYAMASTKMGAGMESFINCTMDSVMAENQQFAQLRCLRCSTADSPTNMKGAEALSVEHDGAMLIVFLGP